jgi:hypothetical protein
MAQVYTHPQEVSDFKDNLISDYDAYEKEIERFKSDLKEFCKKNSECPHAGEIIGFPVADGKALYMVHDYRSLIHLPFYDAYAIPDAHARGLLKADIIAHVKREQAVKALFTA